MTSRSDFTEDETKVAEGFRRMPRPKLSTEDKAKMLAELRRRVSTDKLHSVPRWVTGGIAAVAGVAIVAAGFFAMKSGSQKPETNVPAVIANPTNTNPQQGKLEAATSRLQMITDKFGDKAPKLHALLTHTVGLLDVWAYGKSEDPGQGDYSFDYPFPGMKQYIQKDYDQFKSLFGSELAQIPAKPDKSGLNTYTQERKVNGGMVLTVREDWAVIDAINKAYQQALDYYNPSAYEKLSPKLESTVGNDTEATQAANTLREWNDLLFGGRIQLDDIPKGNQ